MTVNIETPNRHYPQPHPDNVMKTVDVPRLILALEMLDADMAAVFAAVAGKAPSEHQHAMTEIIGLVAALAGKSPTGHNHGIGTLTGVDLSSAANGQFMKFNGTLWIPAFISAADLAAKIITDAHLRDSNGVSVLGRSVATPGRPADISALTNDRLLARVGDALAFVQMTIGMVPDGLITFAKLASADAIARLGAEGQVVTGGASVTSKELGTAGNLAGLTLVVTPAARPQQHGNNNGGFTWNPPTVAGSCFVDIINVTGAGPITLGAWTLIDGEFDTAVGSKFNCHQYLGVSGSALTIRKLV